VARAPSGWRRPLSNWLVGDWVRVGFNTEGTEFAEEDEDTPPPVFFVRVANTGLMLDAASRIVTKGDGCTVAIGRRRASNGSVGVDERVDFNAPPGPEQAPGAEFTERGGRPPLPGYPRVMK
jgi:hypothetical protein